MTPDYQTFDVAYPRYRLTHLPSPLERAERFEAALRAHGCVLVPRIYIKRDDLLSLGLGGNKIRNLEFLIGDALARGATDVITAGRVQSNHCRLTAAACARAGLTSHLVFLGFPPERATANLLLDQLFGAHVYFTHSDDRASRAARIDTLGAALSSAGRTPYAIPVGGAGVIGAVGHAIASHELAMQLGTAGEHRATIVLATATGGTQAGMLAGFRKIGFDAGIHAFAIAKAADELASETLGTGADVARAIGASPIDTEAVLVDGSALGAGYGIPSAAGQAAIELLASSEGILADPVYTGKALAGLIQMVRGSLRPDAAIVFIHTGGTPALFADLRPQRNETASFETT